MIDNEMSKPMNTAHKSDSQPIVDHMDKNLQRCAPRAALGVILPFEAGMRKSGRARACLASGNMEA